MVIIDTAGRLAVDEEMMDEITRIKQAVQPAETLFVVDSMTGRDAVNTAKAFNDRLDFDGGTDQADGDTRGGAALTIKYRSTSPLSSSVRARRQIPWMYFHPIVWPAASWAWVILFHWWRKPRNSMTLNRRQSCNERSGKNKFDFDDFLSQIGQIKKKWEHQRPDGHDSRCWKTTQGSGRG